MWTSDIKKNIPLKTVNRVVRKDAMGKNGKDIIPKVPEGTIIFDAESHKVIADMSGANKRQVILLRR